ncbi:hypothetical protein MM221_07835 [Salipaludibacillus sp. LMS25]|jgi:hypothetical protein|uniref:hypothetical protein n=1 Tax=Salipaludibacillus sp. LMS25 TaxID=2924031 RepID=UPI0020D02244|nr:hypothetical protein [Salipaludibacillus sp. LMS25]UTR16441.1 hypothetical protein MM221_07835 [Salipaludibacillus sp. LMS25]
MNERTSDKECMSEPAPIKSWLFIGVLSFIPIVNIVAFFILVFYEESNPSVRNYGRAGLLNVGIVVIAIAIVSMYLPIDMDEVRREIVLRMSF